MLVAKAWNERNQDIDDGVPVFSSDDIPEVYRERIVLVDDVRMTGRTMAEAASLLAPNVLAKAVLVHKGRASDILSGLEVAAGEWVTFPWETREAGGIPLDAVERLIEYAGDDPTRLGLKDTPARVLRFLDEIRENPYQPMAFESSIGDLQVTGNIPFAGLCEHHLQSYWGTAAIGYIPNGKLIGLSKASRALASAASGLTMQEEVTARAAKLISQDADTPDVAVVTTAQHSCMIARGVKAIGSYSVSSAMLGKFRVSPALRAEFMALAKVAS